MRKIRADPNYVAEASKGNLEATSNCMNSTHFQNAEIVVISDSFEPYEIQYIDDFIQFLNSNGKQVVVLGRAMRWHPKPQLKTYLDELFLKNGDSLNGIDFETEKQNFYQVRRLEEDADLDTIRAIAEVNGALFLNKWEYQCDLEIGSCDLVTDAYRKIYSDFHHTTLEGAEYFGKKISEMDWFEIGEIEP